MKGWQLHLPATDVHKALLPNWTRLHFRARLNSSHNRPSGTRTRSVAVQQTHTRHVDHCHDHISLMGMSMEQREGFSVTTDCITYIQFE
ncbi:unnamed protein product [Protopolystoma xenopodis]|uniref:Uncharacterized protein n=1 Tax=Protopolystoma xenopodis TaxID=117903 RepID=A0A3S5BB92_9PLAT|nr:unnamed protein product [Protopolystoma xenopodis]